MQGRILALVLLIAGRVASDVPAGDTSLPTRNTSRPTRNTSLPARNTSLPARNTSLPTRNTSLPTRNTSLPTGITSLPNTFLYFGYASNLLAQRIHINNPSAVRYAIGELKDYRLDFNGYSTAWGGSPATIVPDQGSHVWGAVWTIDSAKQEDLDRQEGVHTGLYIAINVTVESPSGEKIVGRCYQMTAQPPAQGDDAVLPVDRRPSPVYREVIIQGAQESGLPQEYVARLKAIPHNGYNGTIGIPVDVIFRNL